MMLYADYIVCSQRHRNSTLIFTSRITKVYFTSLPEDKCICPSDLQRPGRTRFERLFHIGRSSVPLCVDALKAAVQEAKAGKDILRYQMAVNSLFQAARNEPEALLDKAWLDAKAKENRETTLHLQAELQGYKNNLIKESIRVCT